MSAFVLGVWFIGLCAQEPALPGRESVLIEQQASGCFHHEERSHEWVLVGDEFRWRDRSVSRAEMRSVLRTIVGARQEVQEVLREIGITAESIRAHRNAIAATVTPETFRAKHREAEVLLELDRLLEWDRIAPLIRDELLGKNWASTERRLIRATFAVDGRKVVVESKGLVPWMLPWTVAVDRGYAFSSEDLAVPRALRKLIDPEGPGAEGLDGDSYWAAAFWSDRSFWRGSVGRELDRHLSEGESTTLPGWIAASRRFELLDVQTGSINAQPESMFFELESRIPAAVDRARWHDFLVDGRPAQTWDDFLALYERADACVSQQHWLLEWKAASQERQVELEAAGTQGFSETMLEELVLPAWEDAGFPGRPELELLMREKGRAVGTIYLATGVHGCLIESAHLDRVLARSMPASRGGDRVPETTGSEQGGRRHWFDELEFSFHPRGDPPTYGRVDAAGRVEVRTMAPVPLGRR